MRRDLLLSGLLLAAACGGEYPIAQAPPEERVQPESLPAVVKAPPGLKVYRAIRGPRQLIVELRAPDTTTGFVVPRIAVPQPLPPELDASYNDTLFLAVARDAWIRDASKQPADYVAVVAWLTPNNGRVMCLSARQARAGWFTRVSFDHCARK